MNKSLKGGRFEREVSGRLSTWWSDGRHDDWFWRTAGSGGRATTRAKRGKQTENSAGDIGATHAEAVPLIKLLTYELKRGYNAVSVQDLLDKPAKSIFAEFIGQAGNSATVAGTKYWSLILQRDRRVPLVLLNHYPFPDEHSPNFLHLAMQRPGQSLSDSTIFMCPLENYLVPETRLFYLNEIAKLSSNTEGRVP